MEPSQLPPWKLYSTFSFHSAEADTPSARITMNKPNRRATDRGQFLRIIARPHSNGIPGAAEGVGGTARLSAILIPFGAGVHRKFWLKPCPICDGTGNETVP